MRKLAVVVLAAGQSTRMKSKLVKVLHPIAGRPMIEYVLDAVESLEAGRAYLVVAKDAEQVRLALGDRVIYVEQGQQLGTGHALLQARPLLEGRAETVLSIYGDNPLIAASTLRRLAQVHEETNATVTLLTVLSEESLGFGRILRDSNKRINAIIEEAMASPEERQIRELNAGVYCLSDRWLWPHLAGLPLSPKGEYFLTDLVEAAAREGETISSLAVEDISEVLGINNRVHLAQAERVVRERVRHELMLSGVTLMDPATIYVDSTVKIGPDTVIYPNCYILGETTIGNDCSIGPNCQIVDSEIGNGCRLVASVVEEATLAEAVHVGPFAHLRPGSRLAAGVHVGNFAEVKMSTLGPGTKVHHVSYLGDARVGADVNIGAGTVTCNFDGERKHPTVIEDSAFIGSDTMLVAPVKVGRRARTGAGSVVTRDIPEGKTAYGVPARVREK
ncbi:MAG: bifunctional UDP-N-acetylglucosamine diphosphorylase/glucosamine-1-phosphate N-acetyltransferase GlmU [Chloroflexota bacterium]